MRDTNPHSINYSGKICSGIDMQIYVGNAFYNFVTLTFDLLTSGSVHAKPRFCRGYYISTEFGVHSSSRFAFRVHTHTDRQIDKQTDKVTDATYHYTSPRLPQA